MQIEFSEIAKQSLAEQIAFLELIWTNKEITNLLNDIKKVLVNLKSNKYKHYQLFARDIRSALIGKKHVRMFFRKENDNLIKVLLFFDIRQNPIKF